MEVTVMKNMKIAGLAGILGFLLIMGLVSPVFSQSIPGLDDLRDAMDDFSDKMAKSLPFNSSIGLNWSDAYIGNFLAIPPHFGAGISLGFTTMEGEALGKLMDQFNISLPIDIGGYPLFGWAVEGRLGGFILPFDIGIKFGILPVPISKEDLKLDYMLLGLDVRYALIKQSVTKPNLSFGVGFNYLNGGIEKKIGEERKFDYPTDDHGGISTLTLKRPTVGFNWGTSSLDLKLQISKSFVFITPYLGFGASKGWSKAGYSVKTTITDSEGNLDAAMAIAEGFGINDLSDNGFSSEKVFDGWSFRAFGGFSINITFLKIDITGLYNIRDNKYGTSLGFRVQM